MSDLDSAKIERSMRGLGNSLDELALSLVSSDVKTEGKQTRLLACRSRFMELLVPASRKDPNLALMLEKWSSMSVAGRNKYTIDELAYVCAVEPSRVVAAASVAAYDLGFNSGSIVAMSNFPKVIENTLASASIPGREGVKDRELLMRHARFVPVPDGQTINIQNIANARSTPSLESFEDAMKRFDKACEPTIEAECIPQE